MSNPPPVCRTPRGPCRAAAGTLAPRSDTPLPDADSPTARSRSRRHRHIHAGARRAPARPRISSRRPGAARPGSDTYRRAAISCAASDEPPTPTRLSIQRLEPCGDGVSARSRVDDTVSDTENPAWHLRALSRPHRRIHALSVSKIAGIRASGQFASAIPSLIPSGSFRCDSRYRLSPALDDNTNASDLTREHHQPTAHLATHP